MTFFDSKDHTELKNYKYTSGKYTVVDNLLNPIYLYITNLFPEWFAPNLMTFIGVLFTLSSTLIYIYYKPNFEGHAPNWVYYYSAAAVMIYQALDYMDGKQARRLGISGPLGELFDHGCDALNTFFFVVNVSCALNLGASAIFKFTMIFSTFLFDCAQATEYKSGILLHSNSIFGVTEIQLIVAVMHIIPALYDEYFFFKVLPIINLSIAHVYSYIVGLLLFPSCLYMIYNYLLPSNILPKESRGNKNINRYIEQLFLPTSF